MTNDFPSENGGIIHSPHRTYMSKAYQEAEKALEKGEVPVGAVIVCNNMVIGRGHNQVESLYDPTAHAEMIAISAAIEHLGEKYLTGCSLYVTLEPCPMCAGALVWSKIDRIVFGALDDTAGACGSLFNIARNEKLNHRIEVIHGFMEQECSSLLTEFFNRKRNSNQ